MQFPIKLYRTLIIASSSIVLAMIGGCATGPNVRADFDRQVAFSEFKTYGFPTTTGTDRGGYTTLVTTYFKDVIQREMNSRGYTYSPNNPDLLINFYSESRSKISAYARPMSTFDMAFGYAPLYRRRGHYVYPYYGWYVPWPMFEPEIETRETETSSIKIDVVDSQKKQSVWEARAEHYVSEETRNNPQLFIDMMVIAMFRKYPTTVTGAVSN
jgi:hypothetical protein